MSEVVELCSKLIQCKSVTPNDDGVLNVIESYLSEIGFDVQILEFCNEDKTNCIKNLFARFGTCEKNTLGFLGHADVVPVGDSWDVDPFAAVIKDGELIGRGVADMKGGVAAFCVAAKNFLKNQKAFADNGSIMVLITCDEEIGTYEGARALIDWCIKNNYIPQSTLVGEPSSDKILGDRVFAGHRGSMNVIVTSVGKQGHSAYPTNYQNSLAEVCKYIAHMKNYDFSYSDFRFAKTHLEPTMLHTGNYAINVVPGVTSANINVRYSSDYTSKDIQKIFLKAAESFNINIEFDLSGDPYYCDDKNLHSMMSDAICENTKIRPKFSAEGGTSDGRFLHAYSKVIEFGVKDETIHQQNEHTSVDDLNTLAKIYEAFLGKYFL